ncbi:MAG TPA: hypothetical protein VM491_04555, partial [Burkholderiaceae bacterium]|nr:hypothetical protein [Burkholderiaceae bacterium]
MRLGFGLRFEDLYQRDGLLRLDQAFLQWLGERAPQLAERLCSARGAPDSLEYRQEAALLIEAAPWVDEFIAALFDIGDELAALRARHTELAPLYEAKTRFVKRQALQKIDPAQLAAFDADAARERLLEWVGTPTFDELALARAILDWQRDETANAAQLQIAMLYSAWAVTTEAGNAKHGRGVLFRQPGRIEPLALIRHAHSESVDGATVHAIDASRLRRRLDNGRGAFSLTDPGTDLAGALDETHYCILCHNQGKDSCSKGLRDKPGPDGSTRYKHSALGVQLPGCPLEQRISEFHAVKRDGLAVAALAMIVIDNPLCAATGHRICNDCMKACIYQKQTPVDIPQAETRTLKDVLELPWGFEIYS